VPRPGRISPNSQDFTHQARNLGVQTGPNADFVQEIGPPLHHTDALDPIVGPVVDPTDLVAIAMRQLRFNDIPIENFAAVENRAGGRPEAMSSILGPATPIAGFVPNQVGAKTVQIAKISAGPISI
jgi:hypothetical protein